MGTRRALPHVSLEIVQCQLGQPARRVGGLGPWVPRGWGSWGPRGLGRAQAVPWPVGACAGWGARSWGSRQSGWAAAGGYRDWQDLHGNPGETVPEPSSLRRRVCGHAWYGDSWNGGGLALVKGGSFCRSAAAEEAQCPGSCWGVNSVCGGLRASHIPTTHLQRGVVAAENLLQGAGAPTCSLWGVWVLVGGPGCCGEAAGACPALGLLCLLLIPVSVNGRAGGTCAGGLGVVSSWWDPPGKGGARAPLLAGCQPAEEEQGREVTGHS